MFKKWFLLLLACLMVFTLAACNKEEPTPPSNDDPSPNLQNPTTNTNPQAPTLMDSGTLQNGAITWEIYSSDGKSGKLYLKGNGALEDFENAEDQPWWVYGDDTMYGDRNIMEEDIVLVTAIIVESGITELGEYAFAEQESVTEVTLPSTLTTLSDSCFQNCKNLRTVSGGTGIVSIEGNVFEYCTVLESIELSSALTTIGWNAFGDPQQRDLTIRFHGTQAQWNAITVDVGNGKLTSATVLYPTE